MIQRHSYIMLISGNLPGFERRLLNYAQKLGCKVGGIVSLNDTDLIGDFKFSLDDRPLAIRRKNIEIADVSIYFKLRDGDKTGTLKYDFINPSVGEVTDYLWLRPELTKMYINGTEGGIRKARQFLKRFYGKRYLWEKRRGITARKTKYKRVARGDNL